MLANRLRATKKSIEPVAVISDTQSPFALPAGIQAGDFALLFSSQDYEAANMRSITPNEWTPLIGYGAVGDTSRGVWYKFITASDYAGKSYSYTITSYPTLQTTSVVVFRNVTSAVVDYTGVVQNGTTITVGAPGTTGYDGLVFFAYIQDAQNAITSYPPSFKYLRSWQSGGSGGTGNMQAVASYIGDNYAGGETMSWSGYTGGRYKTMIRLYGI